MSAHIALEAMALALKICYSVDAWNRNSFFVIQLFNMVLQRQIYAMLLRPVAI
jgi:hypothetical protein